MTSVAAEHRLTEAFQHQQNGDVDEAERLYRSLLAEDSENLNALQLLGLLCHQAGRHADAVELLQRAVALLEQGGGGSAQHAALYNNLGNALRAVGRGTEALAVYQQGLDLNPSLAELHTNIADELCAQGDFEGAIASYESARRCSPLSTRHLCHLGTAYALVSRFSEAEAVYRDAVAPLVQSAMSQHRDPRDNKAAEAGQAKSPTPLTGVDAPVADNKLSAPLDPYRELIAVIPPTPDLYYLLARALRKPGDMHAAIEVLRLALQINPDHLPSLYDLGLSLSQIGLVRLAIPFLERSIAIKPDFAACYVELGNAFYSVGEEERALDCHRRAHQLQPLRTWNATTSPAAFSVLAIEASGAGNTPCQFLLCNCDFDCHFFALVDDAEPNVEILQRYGDVVVNLISDVDQGQQVLPAAAALIDRLGKPVINHPRGIGATDRCTTAERLVGIALLRVPKTIRCHRETLAAPDAVEQLSLKGFGMPFLLRVAGSHGGDNFEQIFGRDDIDKLIEQCPADEFYVTEFVDYQSSDGFYRKYRFIFTNEEILPYHLAIGNDWKVHHYRTDMEHCVWMQKEEKAFLENPWRVFSQTHYRALRKLRVAFDLDFFGIDCSLDREGNIVIFEVNASMLVHDNNATLPYKTLYCNKIRDAFHAMLARAATKVPAVA